MSSEATTAAFRLIKASDSAVNFTEQKEPAKAEEALQSKHLADVTG